MAASRYRILMVDDVSRYHHLYEMAITEALPARVHFAVDGEEGLQKLASTLPYDLLILDLNMPKLNGEETLARIRQDPNFDTMPVIVLTGDGDQETHRRLLDLGADDFVEKGAEPDVFVARLKTQIRHKFALTSLTQLAVDMDIFAAGVLHDIRNLEQTIVAIAHLCRNYLEEDIAVHREQMLADLTALEGKVDRLGAYAGEILRMVRATHKPLKLEAQDVAPLVEWAQQVACPTATLPGVTLTCQLAGGLVPVVADRHFLQLAILNIVQNAVKYRRPEAPVVLVTVSQRSAAASGDGLGAGKVITCLKDHGIGIKRQDLRKVFEPFVRGTSGGEDKISGFGLGLSLVKKVITTMGGRVWAESDGPDQGTTICLELPSAEPVKDLP